MRDLGLPPRLAATLFLSLAFVLAFPEVHHLFSKVFLAGDSLTYYFPLYAWAKAQLAQGRLPLLSDLAYHGAPVAAQSSIGLLSPVLLVLFALPLILGYNLLLFLPLVLSLAGFYRLGRAYGLDRPSSCFLSVLASLNGASSVHLSLFIVTWANAFFPWTWRYLSRAASTAQTRYAWGAAACFGLTIFVGHPQMVLMQGLLLAFWVFLAPEATFRRRLTACLAAVGGGLLFSSPRWLHTMECVFHGAGAVFRWNELDAYFHSWTPFNAVTLLFPDFFGHTPLIGGGTYWWLYHYNEMQFTLGAVGLCFAASFFLQKDPHRRWIGAASIFLILMALGRFGPLYPILHLLPPFSWFRDPARWLLPLGWLLAFAAARASHAWRHEKAMAPQVLPKAAWILFASAGVLWALGNLVVAHAQTAFLPLTEWFIRHFVKGDSLHPGAVSDYVARLSEKLVPLSHSLDLARWEVVAPLVALLATALTLSLCPRRFSPRAATALLLVISLSELSFFSLRMGESGFIDPTALPPPCVPPPTSRSLALTPRTALPDAFSVARLSFPNSQFLTARPSLPYFLYPSLPRYEEIGARLGWMAWIYHDRDAEGWRNRPGLLRALGVDQVSANEPLLASPPFRSVQGGPYGVLSLDGAAPRVESFGRVTVCPWPAFLDQVESSPVSGASRIAYVESRPEVDPSPGVHPVPVVDHWSDLRVDLRTDDPRASFLVVQKTWLPAWRATMDGKEKSIQRAQGVLCGIAVPPGPHVFTFRFDPTGLRLGWFLVFLFLGWGAAIGIRVRYGRRK